MTAATISAHASAVALPLSLSAAMALLDWPWWGSVVITAAAVLIAGVECAIRRTNPKGAR